MGLFSKEPAEKKAYWKAFSAALGKQNDKTFAELESACKAWQSGWQGYLFMGMCYDLAVSKIPFDPKKAVEYHQLAKVAAVVARKNEWVESLYRDYEEYAGNFRVEGEYFPRAMNVRKFSAAMVNNYDPDKNEIVTDLFGKNDLTFWSAIASNIDTGGLFKSTPEQMQCFNQTMALTSLIVAWRNRKGDYDSRINDVNDMLKPWNKVLKLSTSEITLDTEDMRGYLFGYSLVMAGGAYDVLNGEPNWHKNLRIDGFMTLWSAAHRGNTPALHMLAAMFDSDFANEVYYAYSQVYSSGINTRKGILPQLLSMLEDAAVKGDTDAMDYIELVADK